MEATPNLRNGLGDIIAIVGAPSQPLTVDISGITADGWDPKGQPVAVEAGIVFLDARGSVVRSHVTNVVTSEGGDAYLAARRLPRHAARRRHRAGRPTRSTRRSTARACCAIDRTRVEKYNKIGVLIDGATSDNAPVHRRPAPSTGASSPPARSSAARSASTTRAPATARSTTARPARTCSPRARCSARTACASPPAPTRPSRARRVSQNLVLGTGAPIRGAVANNANLALGSGVRYVGAKMNDYTTATGKVNYSHIATSNIIDNAYGAINVGLDGTTRRHGQHPPPVRRRRSATCCSPRTTGGGCTTAATTNTGPAIAPTTNPNAGENPVNGTATPNDIVTLPAVAPSTSNAVDFFPYRNGSQANQSTGQYPVLTAPIPVNDAAPTVALVRAGDRCTRCHDHAHGEPRR